MRGSGAAKHAADVGRLRSGRKLPLELSAQRPPQYRSGDGRCYGRQDRAPRHVGDRQCCRPDLERRLIGKIVSSIGDTAEQGATDKRGYQFTCPQSRTHREPRQARHVNEIEHDCRDRTKAVEQDVLQDGLVERLAGRSQPDKVVLAPSSASSCRVAWSCAEASSSPW